MITDIILLVFLFALLFGLLKLVAVVSPSTPTKPAPGTPGKTPTPGTSGTTFDWQQGQLNLKTNLRPVTQQDLLEKAQQTGMDGGKFVTQHADSFHFGKKEA